jgi:hypothetical protein
VNTDKQANKLPNFTRRMLWVFVGQMMLMVALFVWNDCFPSWVNRIIMATVILFPLMVYLTVLAEPSVRQAWRSLLRDCYLFAVSIPPAIARLFSFATVVKLAQIVASLKPFPETKDDWIALILLPFKTCIVVTFPMIWVFGKIISYFQLYGRASWPSYELIFQCYLISLLALLVGALFQSIFCRAGRATTTSLFFFVGFALLLIGPLILSAIR